MQKYSTAIFDLDGVIMNTAKYHYLAWKRLAEQIGFDFSVNENERLKGVSREKSLEILLEIGHISADEDERKLLMNIKNNWYVEYISSLNSDDILPGTLECLSELKAAGIKTAIGSASKNTPLIVDRLGIGKWFYTVVDGNSVQKAKPDPQCFTLCAQELKVAYTECVVFEDSEAGLEAAKAVGMYAVGIGANKNFHKADITLSGLYEFRKVKHLFGI